VILAAVSGLAAAVRAQPLPSQTEVPSCLDKGIADELEAELEQRGVQERDFLKRKKFALSTRGGMYSGDLTSSAWIGGGALAFYFTEDFSLEASLDMTPISLDLDAPLADFFGDDRFDPGMGYLVLANLQWSPIHAKLKSGGGIVHADVLLFGGGGRLIHDSSQGLAFDAGVALELLLTRFLTVRFDARNVMAVQEAAAETRFTNNIVATAGLTFWIPSGL
jgi:outer membrane beta-barrel protein